MGAVSRRARLGHGARGLQRGRHGVGASSITIRRARAPIAGTKTAWAASATSSSACASRWRCGTARDPILKERAFGLTGNQGNHGEDVKEYYFYLDATPSHSWMRYLYKYPQAEYPYGWLVEENRRRSRQEPAFTLLDTGVFNDDRYFDVEVRYAKASPDEIHIRVIATNRGPEAAPIHLIPQLWFRNDWSWGDPVDKPGAARRSPRRRARNWAVQAEHPTLGDLLFLRPPRGASRCTPRTRATRSACGTCPARRPT